MFFGTVDLLGYEDEIEVPEYSTRNNEGLLQSESRIVKPEKKLTNLS